MSEHTYSFWVLSQNKPRNVLVNQTKKKKKKKEKEKEEEAEEERK